MPEENEGNIHHHYYFGEPSAAILGGLRGGIGALRVATYCDCSTCACGSCACNCSCNACGACYCDCSCSGGGIARFDQAAIAAIIESLQLQLGEIRQIASSMKERK
jgi:hypothetical protein